MLAIDPPFFDLEQSNHSEVLRIKNNHFFRVIGDIHILFDGSLLLLDDQHLHDWASESSFLKIISKAETK